MTRKVRLFEALVPSMLQREPFGPYCAVLESTGEGYGARVARAARLIEVLRRRLVFPVNNSPV